MKEYISVDALSKIRHVSLFNIRYDAGHVFTHRPDAAQSADTMILVLSGSIRCDMPGRETLRMEAGTVTLFPRSERRTSRYLTNTHLLSVHIDSTSPLFSDVNQFSTAGLSDFGRMCLTQLTDTARGAPIGDFAAASCVCGLLAECAERVHESVPERFAAIDAARRAIEREFTSERPIPEYARDAAMSESGFRRLFAMYVGMPPARYRQKLRLEYVRLLVSTGECNLSEAASRAGFNSLPYLCRQFHRYFGVSVSDTLHESDG